MAFVGPYCGTVASTPVQHVLFPDMRYHERSRALRIILEPSGKAIEEHRILSSNWGVESTGFILVGSVLSSNLPFAFEYVTSSFGT